MSPVKRVKNNVFNVPIGNSNNTEMYNFDHHAPEIKYVQNDDNSCVFSSLSSSLFDVNENIAEHALLSKKISYLSFDIVSYMNRIRFANKILTYGVRYKGEQRFR